MVNNIMSLTGNGFKDWWLQRVSAVLIAAYSLFIFMYIVLHPQMSFESWHRLFSCGIVQVATITTLLALWAHTWIGLWTVTTDYIKCTVIRALVQWAIVLFLLAQFIFSIMIIWGR